MLTLHNSKLNDLTIQTPARKGSQQVTAFSNLSKLWPVNKESIIKTHITDSLGFIHQLSSI